LAADLRSTDLGKRHWRRRLSATAKKLYKSKKSTLALCFSEFHFATSHQNLDTKLQLRTLRYFIAVAEELHFGRAARRLNISQPPLSLQIKNLEDELSVLLFERNRREVRLTRAGEVLLKYARALLEDVDRAVLATRQAFRGENDTIEIGYAPPADLSVLPKLFSKMIDQFPELRIVLRGSRSSTMVNELERGKIAAAVVRLPATQAGVEVIRVSRERLVVVTPRGHRFGGMKTIRLKDLSTENLIGFPRWIAPEYFDRISTLCRELGGFVFSLSQEVETIQTALALVAGGTGISLQPESIKVLQRSDILCKSIKDSPLCVEMGVVYLRDRVSPALKNFLTVAKSMEVD
jgi:DNA-binding transcriptional LysR family regulator